MTGDLSDRIFYTKNPESFSENALEIFRFQAEKNPVYKSFINSLGRSPDRIKNINDIPFLPIGFFKTQKVVASDLTVEKVFESSRTTGSVPSRHFVHNLKLYEKSFLEAFRHFYGEPSDYLIAALLPSYTERLNSSLVYMMDRLIKISTNDCSGFYEKDPAGLIKNIQKAKSGGEKTFLIGVSFALLDLAASYPADLSGTIVMETGGMKGRRKEITREELHAILKEKFNIPSVHSEYGMTELLSQAYSKGDGIFFCPPWMKTVIRDPQDPLSVITEKGKAGGINIIDLANVHSCSFIATDDFGKLYENGGFEISGRFDNSEIRGCNLMAE
jgi:phenylacetate-coenzyme A ligase PaaK-like adenylate-forming protein